jgi:hypothetical protein
MTQARVGYERYGYWCGKCNFAIQLADLLPDEIVEKKNLRMNGQA